MVAEAFYCGVIGPCTRYSYNFLYALIPVLIVGLWLKFSASTGMKSNRKINGFLLGVMALLYLMFFWISASRPKIIIENSPSMRLAWATLVINDRFSNESGGVEFYFEHRIKLEWGDSGRLFVGEKLKRNSPRERHLALKILGSVGPHENNKNDLIELLRKGKNDEDEYSIYGCLATYEDPNLDAIMEEGMRKYHNANGGGRLKK
ncbi:MAG: hypothetical protein JWL81_3152 [Verrucomicrobiales bacterium]|nr:hypothetical protein [Verrucomicrobiales bacterium]